LANNYKIIDKESNLFETTVTFTILQNGNHISVTSSKCTCNENLINCPHAVLLLMKRAHENGVLVFDINNIKDIVNSTKEATCLNHVKKEVCKIYF
jgi:hypothetical protein